MNRWFRSKRGRPPPQRRAVDTQARLLDQLYRDHYTELCKTINVTFGAGPPEPEEVVQAAFAKFAALKDTVMIRDPRSFIFIAARNIVLDHKRRAKLKDAYLAEQIALDRELLLEEITPERVLLAKDYFDRLAAAIKTLPYKQQVILAMNRLEGRSYAQIRDATGWSPADISRNMRAGMDSLFDMMESRPTHHQNAAPGAKRHDGNEQD